MKFLIAFMLMVPTAVGISHAGEADVLSVELKRTGEHVYRFNVTVRHADEGWEHYANRWEVLTPGGKVIKTRVLLHPHVNEQPFTRSLSGVKIPVEISEVVIRSHDLVHKYGGKDITVKLPR